MTALAAKVTASISEVKQVSFITAVLMAVALCFHSILEVSLVGYGISRVSCVVGEVGVAGLGIGKSGRQFQWQEKKMFLRRFRRPEASNSVSLESIHQRTLWPQEMVILQSFHVKLN